MQAHDIIIRHQGQTQDHHLQINSGTQSHVEKVLAHSVPCQVDLLVTMDRLHRTERMAWRRLGEALGLEAEGDRLQEVAIHQEEASDREARLRRAMAVEVIPTAEEEVTLLQEQWLVLWVVL